MKGRILRLFGSLMAAIMVTGFLPACGPSGPYQVSPLTVTPVKAGAGRPVTIEATVTNSAAEPGNFTAALKVNDKAVDSKDLPLSPGEKKIVSFSYTANAPGKYQFDVNGARADLEVVKPAEFQVSGLEITSLPLIAGKSFTATAEVKNLSDVEGLFTGNLTAGGITLLTRELALSGGASQKVTLNGTLANAGPQKLEFGGAAKDVTALKPAEIKATTISVTPAIVFPGQRAAIEANVTNAGEIKDTLSVSLTSNGVEVDSQPVTLEPAASGKASFTFVRDTPGNFTIGAGGKSATLTVAAAETYSNNLYYYTISYPEGWDIDTSVKRNVVIDKTDVSIKVIVDTLQPGRTLDEYYGLFMKSNNGLSREWEGDRKTVVIGGVNGYKQSFSVNSTSGTIYGCLVLVNTPRFGFEIMCQATGRPQWDANRAYFDAAIASFKPPVTAVGAYTDSVNGYTFNLPGGWAAVETGDASSPVVMQDPAGTDFLYATVRLESIGEDITAKDLMLTIVDTWKKTYGISVVSQKDLTSVDGTKGYEVVFDIQSQGTTLRLDMSRYIRGSRSCVLTAYTLPSGYSRARPAIDTIINSLTFIEPKPFGVSRQESLFLYKGEIVTLDPAVTEEGQDGIVGALFCGVTKIDKDLKVAPDLAERWDMSADGKTYTFHLRKNATFHNGKPVTAADVKYSWERACSPATESDKASSYLGDIVGANDMLAGKATSMSGLVVLDEHTIQVTIDGSKPYFLDKLAQPAAFIVDKTNVARGKNWTQEPNGAGPFKLKKWVEDDILILERYENYFLGPANLKNVVFRIFAGRPMMMYERGEIDITGVPTYDLERVQDTKNPLNKELLTSFSLDVERVVFNVKMPPFDDVKVRKAFALAVDFAKILEVTDKDNAVRAAGYVPPGIPGSNPDLKPLPYDVAQANQLIKESKYGSVENLPPITFYVYGGVSAKIEAVISMWKQNFGIEVKVEVIEELEEYYERKHKREFQLMLSGWRADYIDPQDFLEIFFLSDSEENQSDYSNPEIDAMLRAAAVEMDSAKRLKMYQEIEKLVLADLPEAPYAWNWKDYVLVKPYVTNYKLYATGVSQWKDITISPH